MKNNNDKSIKKHILESIKEGQLRMKPRWHFVLKAILRVLSIGILFFAIIYLLSFVGLVIHEKDLFNMFELSPRGMHRLMTSIPWIIVMLSMFLLATFYVLVKRYSFVYKKPHLYSIFGIVFFVLFIGFFIHLFDDQFRFPRFGEGHRVPVLGPMHKYYRGDIMERKDFDRFEDRMMPPININKRDF